MFPFAIKLKIKIKTLNIGVLKLCLFALATTFQSHELLTCYFFTMIKRSETVNPTLEDANLSGFLVDTL